MSYLVSLLVVVGALFWIVLPAGVLVMAVVCSRQQRQDPSVVQPCRGYDDTNPAAKACWVPVGVEYCPMHDGSGRTVFIP